MLPVEGMGYPAQGPFGVCLCCVGSDRSLKKEKSWEGGYLKGRCLLQGVHGLSGGLPDGLSGRSIKKNDSWAEVYQGERGPGRWCSPGVRGGVLVMGPADASKRTIRRSRPTTRCDHAQTNKRKDITTGLHIASFVYIDRWKRKNETKTKYNKTIGKDA